MPISGGLLWSISKANERYAITQTRKHGSRRPAKWEGGHYAQKTLCSTLINILNIPGSQYVPSKPAEHLDGIDFNQLYLRVFDS